MSFDEWKFLIISLPSGRHSALGSLSTVVLRLRALLCWAAGASPVFPTDPFCSVGLQSTPWVAAEAVTPIWISRIILELISSVATVLEAGSMSSSRVSPCLPSAASTSSLDSSAFHNPVWASPQSHLPSKGDSFFLIKSFLALVMPTATLTGDLWHFLLCPLSKGILCKISTLLGYSIKLLFTSGPRSNITSSVFKFPVWAQHNSIKTNSNGYGIALYIANVPLELPLHHLLLECSLLESKVIWKCNHLAQQSIHMDVKILHLHFYKPQFENYHFPLLWI